MVVSNVRQIVTKSLCCPDIEIKKQRTVFVNSGNAPTQIMKSYAATRQQLISYKALIKRSGRGRDFEFKRIGLVSSNSPVLQGVQALGSSVTPGNLTILRSPIRSSISRTLTPGIPGMPSLGMGRQGAGDGVSRCPEGYQYGGRFTDNKFSTCGQQLFALPGPLGAAISLIRRALRAGTSVAPPVGTPLGAGDYTDSGIMSRAPQIPKVSLSNPSKVKSQIQQLVKPLAAVDVATARLVRRDGFVLEPVVSPSVLRAIPDNRDMEGAIYIMSVASADLIGKDELGLLSNTGVQKLHYVLPGGHELTLEKRRPLTVGERRKLGRTVNTAIESSNTRDPASRLKMVATETGDGLGYSEKFVGIKNPNEIGKDGRQRWASMAFSKRSARSVDTEDAAAQEIASKPTVASEIGSDITTVAGAIAHIDRGGALSQISPDILQEALAKSSKIKREKISASRFLLTAENGDKYIEKSDAKKFEAISQMFASQVQQHLGLEAPNVIFVGSGDSRRYLVEDAETAVKGGKVNDDAMFRSAPWQEVSRLFISDILTDVQNRNPGSIEIAESNKKTKIVPTTNDGAGLIDLSKISITERTEQDIKDFITEANQQIYKKYYDELKAQQRALAFQFLATLIQRARQFSFSNFKSRLYSDSKLSAGEKIHLNILEKLYDNRLQQLVRSNESYSGIVSGPK
jgi:hypothetical protein